MTFHQPVGQNFAAGIGSVVTTTPGTGTAMISSWIFRCA